MTVRGEARTPGRVVCRDILSKVEGWYLSLVVECEPAPRSLRPGSWSRPGVETFTTLAYGPGEYVEEANDRPLATERETHRLDCRIRGQPALPDG
jgi:putative transposase